MLILLSDQTEKPLEDKGALVACKVIEVMYRYGAVRLRLLYVRVIKVIEKWKLFSAVPLTLI